MDDKHDELGSDGDDDERPGEPQSSAIDIMSAQYQESQQGSASYWNIIVRFSIGPHMGVYCAVNELLKIPFMPCCLVFPIH